MKKEISNHLWLFLCLLVLPYINLQAQKKSATAFTNLIFNNFQFNKNSITFIKKVEALFSMITLEETKLEFKHGTSLAINDTGKIIIDSTQINKPELIIHEIYHLYLKTLGFPRIVFSLPDATLKTKENKAYLNWFNQIIWHKIEHSYFYKRMYKELKVNPYTSLRLELKTLLEKGVIDGLKEETKEIALSAYFLQVWIEAKDEQLLQKFKKLLVTKYNSAGVEKGETLISLFKAKDINNRDDAVGLYIDCFNLLHKSHNIKIELLRIENSKNNYNSQSTAFLSLKSFN